MSDASLNWLPLGCGRVWHASHKTAELSGSSSVCKILNEVDIVFRKLSFGLHGKMAVQDRGMKIELLLYHKSSKILHTGPFELRFSKATFVLCLLLGAAQRRRLLTHSQRSL